MLSHRKFLIGELGCPYRDERPGSDDALLLVRRGAESTPDLGRPPSERPRSSARRGGVTPEAARQAIGRIQAPASLGQRSACLGW